MTPAPALETERLTLRGFGAGDTAVLGRLASDPQITRHLTTAPMSPAEATARAEAHWAESHDGTFGLWAIEARGKIAGCASLKPGSVPGEAEIAYRLLPETWGHGIATEAAACLIRHGFETLGLLRVAAVTAPDNFASQRVLEKLGLQYMGLCAAYGFMFARLFRRGRDDQS
ncbi:GNAT family N-acetyltransferase [Zavarzinia sp.]|uniref:GNAT family N-acetyltransferase n=1 Tax=Zavarzinia sp. TaxID=2027920 RepID=UPI0035666F1C